MLSRKLTLKNVILGNLPLWLALTNVFFSVSLPLLFFLFSH